MLSTFQSLELLKLHRAHLSRVDAALLDLARHNVDGILGYDDKVLLHLVDLANQRSEFLIRLDEHLLLGLRILTNKSLVGCGLHIIIELNRLVLLDGQARSVKKRSRMRQDLLRSSRGSSGRGSGRGSRHS